MWFDPINNMISWNMRNRFDRIRNFMEKGPETQEKILFGLLGKAAGTQWGRKFGFKDIRTYEDFRNQVPLQNYESLSPFIEEVRQGKQNLLWPTRIKWFAKSSGTTGSKSKFIPVSQEALEDCHFRGGRDMLSLYCQKNPDTKLFSGLSLRLGGSTTFNSKNHETYYGDLSALLIENLPFWVEMRSTPSQSVALMDEWETKIEKITQQAIKQNVTGMLGVPSWMLVLCQNVLKTTGAKNLLEVWPNLELYTHGGVSFLPYEEQFREMIPGDQVTYLETYNASEGFFGIQDSFPSLGLLLMLDYGIFYEFIPMDQYNGLDSQAIPLWEVEEGKSYAMVITTNSGLWRYIIGDTVKFTSVAPYRIAITGRTKLFINAFGEEVVIDNAEKAMKMACDVTGAEVMEFTAAPVYMQGSESGAHEWMIEFSKMPDDLAVFKKTLDESLQSINSDYEAKRHKNMALKEPIIHVARNQLFYSWLKNNGKLGGQHKIPRLSNDRTYVEELLALNQ
ncbi:MAG: GH3 auxin-responsive promoter family protein [Bacteroidota bacterium]|nr:GH3 auxin-responsive promoter family protein [Bacteroidota bacterium]MDX5404364.1 GH3 auxin-responsive promoter family protein [Bacteroidota bacterium]MDX5426804.1 GH3 auxin-responsive promoter family protein [Bacteroidota bacterium]MDX5447925.1 GH3 auxin-responsive promoter family protein [Bacteroidota bacterium]MDX5504790.1 GH3 auxin-responsive promoter family protein [Bacteroidota bacterium]